MNNVCSARSFAYTNGMLVVEDMHELDKNLGNGFSGYFH